MLAVMRTYKFVRRDKQIVIMRSEGSTYQDIGDAFNLTRERVRQILDKYGKAGRIRLSPHA